MRPLKDAAGTFSRNFDYGPTIGSGDRLKVIVNS
jgi:hypothetical protein